MIAIVTSNTAIHTRLNLNKITFVIGEITSRQFLGSVTTLREGDIVRIACLPIEIAGVFIVSYAEWVTRHRGDNCNETEYGKCDFHSVEAWT